MTTAEVVHFSGAPSTALRLSDGERLFAFSGDTEWVEALVAVADGADLFICECYGYSGRIAGHVTWEILKPRLPDLRARRIMVTHMNPTMLARLDEVRAAGVLVAEDGMVIERLSCSSTAFSSPLQPRDQARRVPALAAHLLHLGIELVDQRGRPAGWRRSCAPRRVQIDRSLRIQSTAKPKSNLPAVMVL